MRRAKLDPENHQDHAAGAASQPTDLSQREIAEYVRNLTRELARLAQGAHLRLLAYLLDMACLEAEAFLDKQAKTASPNEQRTRASYRRSAP